jgi:hypothetical protein
MLQNKTSGIIKAFGSDHRKFVWSISNGQILLETLKHPGFQIFSNVEIGLFVGTMATSHTLFAGGDLQMERLTPPKQKAGYWDRCWLAGS